MNDKPTSWSERLRFQQVPTAETVAAVFGMLPIAELYDGERLDRRVRLGDLDFSFPEDRMCVALTSWINAVRASSGASQTHSSATHSARLMPIDRTEVDMAATEALLQFHEVLLGDLRVKAKSYIDHDAFARGKIHARDGSDKANRFAAFLKDQVALSRTEDEVLDHLSGPALLERYLDHIIERQLVFIQDGLDRIYDRSATPQR